MNAELLTPESRFVGLFVGPSGSGKKAAACSFPHPIKYYDFDGRIRGLLGCPWVERKGIDYTYYPPKLAGANATSTYQRLNDDFDGLLTSSQVGQCNIQTIVIASLTGLIFSLLCDSVPLTHKDGKGKKLGTMAMPGPEDYGFQANGAYQVMAFLRSIPIPNIIITAHIVDRYGKADPSDSYSERVVVGEKLSITDKVGENIKKDFDHIFRFDKDMMGGRERFTAQFRSDLARTSYSSLPDGLVDITKKDFYQYLMESVKVKEAAA